MTWGYAQICADPSALKLRMDPATHGGSVTNHHKPSPRDAGVLRPSRKNRFTPSVETSIHPRRNCHDIASAVAMTDDVCETVPMSRWWPILKQIATALVGLGLLAYMTWSGITQLCRWLSSGQLMARYGGRRGVPLSFELIAYEDAPLDFALNLGFAMVMAGVGTFIWVKLCFRARQWWTAK